MMGDPLDASGFLRRFETDAIIACMAAAVVTVVVSGGDGRAGLSVLSGGVLAGISYRAVKGTVDAALSRKGPRAALVKNFTRYGILAFVAYVMLARLRLHPIGLLIGSSSLALAAGAAAIRSLRPDRPSSASR
jgi:hypothetical protein